MTFDDKLKSIAEISYQKGNIEKSLAAISACAHYYYEFNQKYCDDNLEEFLLSMGRNTWSDQIKIQNPDENIILFYDGFGLDTRGLALIYLKALTRVGGKIVYVTKEKAKNNQPEIMNAVLRDNIIIEYISDRTGYQGQIDTLIRIFNKYRPHVSFLYTLPYDVVGTTVFNLYQNITRRYQINLTDHAFWLGKNAFDYCIEFRDYGYAVSKKYRNIPEYKLVKLPFYPNINYEDEFQGFPFQTEGYKVVFSGGALYKTISEDNKYYKIVDHILDRHRDVIFLYAGSGEHERIDILARKYPSRVYHVSERKDLYQVMKHSYLYLNTYPILGGLMTQYAVAAGKLPITLKHGQEQEGFLLRQSETEVFFDNIDDLVYEVDKLLQDTEYLEEKQNKLDDLNCLMSPNKFKEELNSLLTTKKTYFSFEEFDIDTSNLRQEYFNRMNANIILNIIARKANKCLIMDFPMMFIKRFLRDVVKI